MAIALNPKGLPPHVQRKLEAMAKEKLNFAFDTTAAAPKPKGKVDEIPELAEALKKLPKGANFFVKESQIAASIVRVHVQRATKAEKEVEDASKRRTFVTRSDKEADGLRIWAV